MPGWDTDALESNLTEIFMGVFLSPLKQKIRRKLTLQTFEITHVRETYSVWAFLSPAWNHLQFINMMQLLQSVQNGMRPKKLQTRELIHNPCKHATLVKLYILIWIKSVLIHYAFEQENWTEKGNMDIFMMGTVNPENVRKL